MNTYCITTFRSYKSPVLEQYELPWEDIVEFFLDGHSVTEDKFSLKAFNATRYKTLDQVLLENPEGVTTSSIDFGQYVRRTKENTVQIEMLIIDYDDGFTIDQAKDRYKDYQYLGYTSHSHLADGVTNKFRLIFPLNSPIPVFKRKGESESQVTLQDITDSIGEFAPGSDPSAYNGTQLFFPPSCPPERIQFAVSWSNEGKLLDWTEWQINTPQVSQGNVGSGEYTPTGRLNRYLLPNQIFHHANGQVIAREVVGKVEKVACPFHGDTKGSEFLVRHESGVVSFTCKHCGTFVLAPERDVSSKSANDDQEDELLVFDKVWMSHDDRTEINNILSSIKKKIISDTGRQKVSSRQLTGKKLRYKFKSHILYLPEGSGKSQLALNFLSDPPTEYFSGKGDLYRNQIIFACKSWKQVIEQHASFEPKLNALGRKAKIAWSFDGAVQRRFKVKVRRTGGGTFRPGDVESEETVQDIVGANSHLSEKFIRLSLAFLREGDRFSNFAIPDIVSVEPFDFTESDEDFFDSLGDDPPAMIFTTFAQLRLLEAKNDHIPLNWIIWIDDPDIDELIDIKPAKETKRKPKKEKPIIDGTRYDVRDEHLSLALPLKDHRCIYTTTERVTVKKLKHFLDSRDEDYELHGDRYHVTGGKVTILGTKAVQKKYDALIPLIARRINQTTEKNLLLIADGIPSEFNHATNKGRNDLSERNTIVEISHPHPVSVKSICDSMGLVFDTHRDEISKDLMLDKMHQAIGRNSGFRSNGGECVVLVDKGRHDYLVRECSYRIDTVNSVIIDRTEKMTRKEKRISDSATPLVKMIEEIINNPHNYFGESRKIKSDIRYVVSTIPDPLKVEEYLIRLLVSIGSYSDLRFEENSPRDSQSKKVIDLCNWIIKEFIDPSRKVPFLEKYLREIST